MLIHHLLIPITTLIALMMHFKRALTDLPSFLFALISVSQELKGK